MALYIDADVFLALLKDKDWLKEKAVAFFKSDRGKGCVTSIISCVEVWFYLYKNGLPEKALPCLGAIKDLVHVQSVGVEEVETAAFLAQQYGLSPADAIHAVFGLSNDGIVSSDKSYDKVPGLRRIIL